MIKSKILFIPDTLWGSDSGHRSAQKVVKVLSNLSYRVGVFAPDTSNVNFKKNISNLNYQFYPRTPFRYYNIAPLNIVNDFKVCRHLILFSIFWVGSKITISNYKITLFKFISK